MKDLGKCSFVVLLITGACVGVLYSTWISFFLMVDVWAVLCVYCTRWVMGVNIERRKKRIVLKGIGGVELELELEAEGME